MAFFNGYKTINWFYFFGYCAILCPQYILYLNWKKEIEGDFITRKFKLALKKFIEDDGLKIIGNTKNKKEAINSLMDKFLHKNKEIVTE